MTFNNLRKEAFFDALVNDPPQAENLLTINPVVATPRRPATGGGSGERTIGVMANGMRPFIHLIADYGIGDPAFAEVIQHLRRHLPEAEIVPTAVPALSTLATGFWIAQLALYHPLKDQFVYANTAPRHDDGSPKKNNEGEPLTFARLTNGVRVISTHAGYCLSFVKESIKDFHAIRVGSSGSQFRSRDLFPRVVAKIALDDYSSLGAPLSTATIPAVPKNRIAFVDGYGNIKTTIRLKNWRRTYGEIPDIVRIAINGVSHKVQVADGIFSVPVGSLALAPGSSGGENPFLEISKRAGNAAQVFGYPRVESIVIIQRTIDQR